MEKLSDDLSVLDITDLALNAVYVHVTLGSKQAHDLPELLHRATGDRHAVLGISSYLPQGTTLTGINDKNKWQRGIDNDDWAAR